MQIFCCGFAGGRTGRFGSEGKVTNFVTKVTEKIAGAIQNAVEKDSNLEYIDLSGLRVPGSILCVCGCVWVLCVWANDGVTERRISLKPLCFRFPFPNRREEERPLDVQSKSSCCKGEKGEK